MTEPVAGALADTGPALDLVDTHAHLDEAAFDGDREAVVGRAMAVGVRRIVNIGYRPTRWETSIALAKRYPGVQVALGLHPGHADEFTGTTCDRLRNAIVDCGAAVVAVGEIGLDFYRRGYDEPAQRRAFAAQIDLARDLGLPIVIHQRAAEAACVEMLRAAPPELAIVLHSFDGTWELARLGIERGYYFGVGGLMTRAGANVVREILTEVPLERLLLETDAPYLTPNGVKARRNEPANIPLIAARLAALRGLDVAEIAAMTTRNAIDVFDLRPADAADSGPGRWDRGNQHGGTDVASGHV